jgi:hypothetical protein
MVSRGADPVVGSGQQRCPRHPDGGGRDQAVVDERSSPGWLLVAGEMQQLGEEGRAQVRKRNSRSPTGGGISAEAELPSAGSLLQQAFQFGIVEEAPVSLREGMHWSQSSYVT